ncbi:MAG TPA: GAF domain-containing protein [Candidatus Dormibacteraeota bacterium]|nr:GAF domain-containing protein [Candidatus Dormibacteraeota bacterium]
MTATPDSTLAPVRRSKADLQRELAELHRRLDERTRERDEALQRETATAEVLQVINSSPGELAPVFDGMLEKAMRLCGAAFGLMMVADGEEAPTVASRGVPTAFAEFRRTNPVSMAKGPIFSRLLAGDAIVHTLDLKDDDAYRRGDPLRCATVDLGGGRTSLMVALRRDREVVGAIHLYRQEVRPFTDKQIALLQNFATQAVIAMENARLITETWEALEQQTATAEVLGVINSSPGNLAPVFDAMLEKATRLCGASFGILLNYDGQRFRHAALRGIPTAYAKFMQEHPPIYGPDSAPGRLLAGEDLVHVLDMTDTDLYRSSEPNRQAIAELAGARTVVAVPLRKDDALMGAIVVFRQEVRAFSEKQLSLLQNFAAQAVIAMENARLITETRERAADLQEALEFQTATSDVLKVMSGSVFDLQPILQTVVTTAVQLCRADQAVIYRHQEGEYRWAAGYSLTPEYERIEREVTIRPGSGTLIGRVALERGTVQILDAWSDPLYEVKDDARVGGIHTMLGVPLLRDGFPIGAIGLARRRIEPYTEKQIDLVRTFADQAVIAIENARLITETHAARDEAEAALRELQTAQASLVHAQKMAALGQLTAGIAHEIKNPLNFVNNFAGLSVELLDELKETAAPGIATLDEDTRAEINETVEMLTNNLEKISEHGKRADGIVKSMLEHSRGVTGERREVDLNALVEEALNLAYHGARAQDQSFNITMERDLDPHLTPIALAPQEITRVFLNLFGNGFYAATKRASEAADGFRPVLLVTTRDLGEAVEVRVRDNGTGIPPEIRDKLFQPFFTTKPTGEGTGLGLSISYDILTQQHGGTIEVESEPGAFTEFTIRLPRQ